MTHGENNKIDITTLLAFCLFKCHANAIITLSDHINFTCNKFILTVLNYVAYEILFILLYQIYFK